jgi:glycosyltransferase involved in cell wall biosynthesis
MTTISATDEQPFPLAGGQEDSAPPVTVILPAHNEAATIGTTIRNVRRLYPEYECLVIDDASTDGTQAVAKREGARVVRNEMNRGYGAALKRGMRQARGEVVVFMDADGQHDPTDLAKLVESLDGCDMVVGERSWKDQVAVRKPGKWLLTKVARFLINRDIPDINSGFRALYRKDGLRFLPILPNGFSLTTTITLAMLKDGYEVRYIPIDVAPRGGGKSRVSYFRDGAKTLLLVARVIMLFNPLKVFVPAGTALLVAGLIYTALSALMTQNVADTSVVLTLSGLGTLFFGLLADQVSNIRRGG